MAKRAFTRREMLLSTGMLAGGIFLGCRSSVGEDAHQRVARGKRALQSFCMSEGETLEALSDVVLPDTRGFDAVAYIDRSVGLRAEIDLFRRGARWLEGTSKRLFGARFHEIGRIHRNVLLKLIAEIKNEKDRKQLDPTGEGRKFLNRFRYHAFKGFYSSKAGWALVGFLGPPQRTGHCGP